MGKTQEQRNRAALQAVGWGVRAIVDAIQAAGPACNLPKISQGTITNPIRDYTEDEVRRELNRRCHRKLEFMQEHIDFY